MTTLIASCALMSGLYVSMPLLSYTYISLRDIQAAIITNFQWLVALNNLEFWTLICRVFQHASLQLYISFA